LLLKTYSCIIEYQQITDLNIYRLMDCLKKRSRFLRKWTISKSLKRYIYIYFFSNTHISKKIIIKYCTFLKYSWVCFKIKIQRSKIRSLWAKLDVDANIILYLKTIMFKRFDFTHQVIFHSDKFEHTNI